MTIIEIRVPEIGDAKDVPIVEIPVKPGDSVVEGDTIAVLETDKATLDVPSSASGRILTIGVAVGDRVAKDSVLLTLEAATAGAQEAPQQPPPSAPPPTATAATPPVVATPAVVVPPTPPLQVPVPGEPVYASPTVRQFARKLGVSVVEVTGSGPHGRVLREDVEAFVKARLTAPPPATSAAGLPFALPAWPQVDFARFGPVERQPLSRIARLSGPALARNALVIPHVTNFDRADVTALDEFRKTLNGEAGSEEAKITMLAFAVIASVAALKAFPKFNASLDGDELVLKRYWHIGVAADTPDGLVVPVIRDADRKGLREIAAEMAHLADAARRGKLGAADMQGACFTISSLGGIGGTGFTPIINAPEVAILGLTRAGIEPVWDGQGFQPRLMQPLALSWDHRVVDGVAAARFLGHIARSLGDFRRILV